ncbi:MAG: glycosyltransferase, partial [Magnetococcales bacterium]|nr:glycosyltransferase [Magnetococcales bacterium]
AGARMVAAMAGLGWQCELSSLVDAPGSEGYEAIAALCRRLDAQRLVFLDDMASCMAFAQQERIRMITALRQELGSLKVVACLLENWSHSPILLRKLLALVDVIWTMEDGNTPPWDDPVCANRVLHTPFPVSVRTPPTWQPLSARMVVDSRGAGENWLTTVWTAAAEGVGLSLERRELTGEELADTGCVVQFSLRPDLQRVMTERSLETVLSGALLVQERCERLDHFLIPGVHCLAFSTLDEWRAIGAFLANRPEEAEAIRRAGHQFARSHYGAASLPGLLEGVLAAVPDGTPGAEPVTVLTPVYLNCPERMRYFEQSMETFYRCNRYSGPVIHHLVDDRSPMGQELIQRLCQRYGMRLLGTMNESTRRGFFDVFQTLVESVTTDTFLYLEPDHWFYLEADFIAPALRLFKLVPDLCQVYFRGCGSTRFRAIDPHTRVTHHGTLLHHVYIDQENSGWIGRGRFCETFSLMPSLFSTGMVRMTIAGQFIPGGPASLEDTIAAAWQYRAMVAYLNNQAFCYHVGAAGKEGLGGYTVPNDRGLEAVWSSRDLGPERLEPAREAARTRLREITNRHGSDKGDSSHERHGYTNLYADMLALFGPRVRLVEIGIMDPRFPGASLRAWREYLPQAELFGLDIVDASAVGRETDTRTFLCDQSKEGDLLAAIRQIGEVDVIVDDGSHVDAHILLTLRTLFPHVRPGGFFVVEDLHAAVMARHALQTQLDAYVDIDQVDWSGVDCDGKVFILRKTMPG